MVTCPHCGSKKKSGEKTGVWKRGTVPHVRPEPHMTQRFTCLNPECCRHFERPMKKEKGR